MELLLPLIGYLDEALTLVLDPFHLLAPVLLHEILPAAINVVQSACLALVVDQRLTQDRVLEQVASRIFMVHGVYARLTRLSYPWYRDLLLPSWQSSRSYGVARNNRILLGLGQPLVDLGQLVSLIRLRRADCKDHRILSHRP